MSGSDILNGGADNDRLYADTQMTVEQAITRGNSDTNQSAKGDWLSGGSGDDTIVCTNTTARIKGMDGNDKIRVAANDTNHNYLFERKAA